MWRWCGRRNGSSGRHRGSRRVRPWRMPGGHWPSRDGWRPANRDHRRRTVKQGRNGARLARHRSKTWTRATIPCVWASASGRLPLRFEANRQKASGQARADFEGGACRATRRIKVAPLCLKSRQRTPRDRVKWLDGQRLAEAWIRLRRAGPVRGWPGPVRDETRPREGCSSRPADSAGPPVHAGRGRAPGCRSRRETCASFGSRLRARE